MDFKKIMPDINKYISKNHNYLKSDEKSHKGFVVPDVIQKYGSMKSMKKDLLHMRTLMLRTLIKMKKSYTQLRSQPIAPIYEISDLQLKEFTEYANELGVQKIGFAKVNNSYIFKNKKILFPYAIVLLMEMKHSEIEKAPSKETVKEIFRTYHDLGNAANLLSTYLKERGYNAQAQPALGGDINYPLLAQKAGMGLIGKHGLLITEEFGPSLRLAAVLTSIENLPLNEGNEYTWIEDFCNDCKQCVKSCPSNAIYENTTIFTDGTKQHIDYKKCAVPFSNQHGCTICVRDCTFFKGEFKQIKRSFFHNK